MAAPVPLVARIRGEYREMPGLRLTSAQACRLWQIDPATCNEVLGELISEGFLHRTTDGSYVVLPGPQRAVRASMTSPRAARARARRLA